MAWYKRYGIPFESRLHTQYMVYILTKTNPSSITYLTGAAEPFVTQESKEDDIFLPIRMQTGRLSIIDETQDGSLLNDLIPVNNTEKLVQLWSGTWNESHTTFTDGTLCWQGFLRSQAFTQPWEGNKKVIELPVNSLLASLENVSLAPSDAGGTINIAKLVKQAFDALGVTPSYVYLETNIKGSWASSVYTSNFWELRIQSESLYTLEDNVEEGQSISQWTGMSYYDALSVALRLFGLMAREDGTNIHFAMYDKVSAAIHSLKFAWSTIEAIASSGTPSGQPVESWPSDRNLPDSFYGKNNTEEFLQGARSALVRLPVPDYQVHVDLPATSEDASQVYEVSVTNPTVKVQPHPPRSHNIESFLFIEYSGYTLVDESDYAACLANSVILNNTGWISEHTITGAFPCRWLHAEGQNSPTLKTGLFLNQLFIAPWTSLPFDNWWAYRLKSGISYKLSDGYLQLKFNNYNFDQGYTGTTTHPNTPTTPHFGKWSGVSPAPDALQTDLYVLIVFGNKCWKESTKSWVTYNYTAMFYNEMTAISFDNEGIISNKTSDMAVSEDDGFFIPINSALSGNIEIYIAEIASHREGNNYRYVHSRIISDLRIQYLPTIEEVSSQRSVNNYRQTILESGFESEKAIMLNVGTNNNNKPSPVFIKNNSDQFVESITFMDANRNSKVERPENNLLSRMAAHYATVRRAYTAQLESGSSLVSSAFYYLNKRFFGIDAKHNWRDDTQEVKFIEVS